MSQSQKPVNKVLIVKFVMSYLKSGHNLFMLQYLILKHALKPNLESDLGFQ